MNTFPRTSRHGRSRYATQGTTLVELMVALVLGLLVVSVVGYAYVGSKQAFRMQDALSRMQENARFVFETLGYDLRQTGSPGCYFDASKSVIVGDVARNP